MIAAQNDLTRLTASLFAQAGIVGGPMGIFPLPPGRNNRVTRVEAISGESYLLKIYSKDPRDGRDRLGTEWNFSSFLWECGVRCIAEPIACDPSEDAALYRFIDGVPFGSAIKPDHLRAAGGFIQTLNNFRAEAQKKNIGPASEACFSLEEHLECVKRRLSKLENIADGTPIECEAKLFVSRELLPVWDRIRDNVLFESTASPAYPVTTLLPAERCLSPSDFGYHNALTESGGLIHWLDFEYAGFDDPAKLVCDFFCQPKVPVNPGYWSLFLHSCFWPEEERRRIEARARLLLPVYRIKWCCILLNEFLPTGAARRAFALGGQRDPRLEALQLAKARHALVSGSTEDICHGLY